MSQEPTQTAHRLRELAERVVSRARELGADEASASASQSTHSALTRRDGRVEQATEATSRGITISLLLEDRYSSHSTSDLRPEALEDFLQRAVAATRFLEPDPDRRQPSSELCGRGSSSEQLDQLDPAYAERSPQERASQALALEQAVDARAPESGISHAIHLADGSSETARVMSNGFSDAHAGAWFSGGAEMTLADSDGRRPEAAAFYATRYLQDLPGPQAIAEELVRRATERLGARSIESGRYTLLLENRAARRILSTLMAPMSGGALHHGRSCLEGKLGQAIGSSKLTIVDDPTIPRGLASRPWDGDALVARPRTVVAEGVLQQYYLNTYYARKLEMEPTTGSSTNWVLPPGDRSWQQVARERDKAIRVRGFLGGNANPATGDFSFGVQGVLYERGEPTTSLAEMNVTGNALTFFHQLVELCDDPWSYGSVMSPTLVFDDVQFSGT